MTLDGLRDRLTPYDRPGPQGVYRLTLGGADHPVAFDPALYEATPGLNLLTWGSPLLDRLLAWLDS